MKVKKTPHINTAMNGCIVTNTSIYPKSKITFPFQQNTLKFRSRTNHLRQFQEIVLLFLSVFGKMKQRFWIDHTDLDKNNQGGGF